MKKLFIALVIVACAAPAFAQYTGKLQGKKVITETLTVPSGTDSLTISTDVTVTAISGNGAGLTTLTPENISAGALGATVRVSSVAVGSVYDTAIVGVAGSKVSGDISGNAASITGSINATQVAPGTLSVFVVASSIAVGAVQSDSIISLDASKLTGTLSNDRLDNSSVTLQGNTFNGNSQLVRLETDGKLPALDATNLTNIPGITKSIQFGGSNYTLGVATFAYTTPSANISVRRITVTILSSGEGGSAGTVWACGSSGNYMSVTTSAGLTAGSTVTDTATGPKAITSGTAFMLQMLSSDESITPTANVVCDYQ